MRKRWEYNKKNHKFQATFSNTHRWCTYILVAAHGVEEKFMSKKFFFYNFTKFSNTKSIKITLRTKHKRTLSESLLPHQISRQMAKEEEGKHAHSLLAFQVSKIFLLRPKKNLMMLNIFHHLISSQCYVVISTIFLATARSSPYQFNASKLIMSV